jgi:hypothetical protein
MVIISENSATVFSIALFFAFGIRRRNADKMWL